MVRAGRITWSDGQFATSFSLPCLMVKVHGGVACQLCHDASGSMCVYIFFLRPVADHLHLPADPAYINPLAVCWAKHTNSKCSFLSFTSFFSPYYLKKVQSSRVWAFQTNSQDEAWEPKKERRIQQVPEGAKIKALHHFAMRCYAAPMAWLTRSIFFASSDFPLL